MATIAGGMPFVTRYEACRAVLRDIESFSNASGFKAPGVVIPPEDRLLGELDPPRHTLVRRVVVTALTPRVVHEAEAFMAETARRLLDAIPVPGTADLVPAFTVSLPNQVTVHLLGLPAGDADQLAVWAKELMESGFPATNRSERGVGFAAAFPDFAGYIDDQVARIEAHPEADHVLARLVFLESDGERLPRRQVRALVRNLITGGLTTTSQLLGNLVLRVLTDPSVEDAMRSNDAALTGAIEESLRLAPPVLFIFRGCVHATQIAGRDMTEGERVVVGTGSANRDEQVFADGATFDPTRENADQHLTFGYGQHVCPGAALARTVARVGLTTFFERFPAGTVRLAEGFRFENVPTFFEVGPRRLPIETRPAG
ncbi:MAG TPA: cytochrome P450 [Acidimicrobiia bacterium]